MEGWFITSGGYILSAMTKGGHLAFQGLFTELEGAYELLLTVYGGIGSDEGRKGG